MEKVNQSTTKTGGNDMTSGFLDLACAVIEQAVTDARMIVPDGNEYDKQRREKEDAIDFLTTRRLEDHIRLYQLELNPEYIRRKLKGGEYHEVQI